MARHYRIPEGTGGVIEGRTIGGTLPTLRLQLKYFDAMEVKEIQLAANAERMPTT
jgi:hypothetical protein